MDYRFLVSAFLSFTPATVRAGNAASPPEPVHSPQTTALDSNGSSLGDILFPHLHFQATYGRTTFEDGDGFKAGHHDPASDGWTVQGFEFGLGGRFSEHLEGFATWHGFWESDSPHSFDSGFEEYFLKLKKLPGDLELRGGQYLNRFGFHNATHIHGWDWADNYLVNGRFLGDDGFASRGAELTWRIPVKWTSVLVASCGKMAVIHEHEHEHDEVEALYEAEGAAWEDHVLTLHWTNSWNLNDFHQFRGGLSAARGDNVWGRTTALYGAHVQYEWRGNGLEPGGDYLRWRTEVMWRDAAVQSGHLPGEEPDGDGGEDSLAGSIEDWGLYSSVAWGKALRRGVLEAGLRYDYVSGERDAGLPARHRISPGLTWYHDSQRTAFVRLQANFDDIENHDDETSVWLNFGFNLEGKHTH